jgi:hypothetical protein
MGAPLLDAFAWNAGFIDPGSLAYRVGGFSVIV